MPLLEQERMPTADSVPMQGDCCTRQMQFLMCIKHIDVYSVIFTQDRPRKRLLPRRVGGLMFIFSVEVMHSAFKIYLFHHFKAENETGALVLRAYESFGGHNSTRIVSTFDVSKVQR